MRRLFDSYARGGPGAGRRPWRFRDRNCRRYSECKRSGAGRAAGHERNDRRLVGEGCHVLDTDFTYKRAAGEPTRVYVAQDGSFLDVAFAVTQKESKNASQVTNSASVLNEDYVGVYLYPQGTNGIAYGFFSNPNGARFQTSSENSAYAPQWVAVAKGTPDGYTVTMRIPLDVIRSIHGRDERRIGVDLRRARARAGRSGFRGNSRRNRASAAVGGAAQAAPSSLRFGRGHHGGQRREHVTRRCGLLASHHADRVAGRNAAPRLFQRRSGPADDRSERVRPSIRRGPSVLHPVGLIFQSALLVFELSEHPLYAVHPDLRAGVRSRRNPRSRPVRGIRRARRRPQRQRPDAQL